MKETQSDWKQFIEMYKAHKITVSVDKSKSPIFMRSSVAPSNWRVTLTFLNILTIIALPTAIVLFFYVSWWIPVIILSLVFTFRAAIKSETAKAVIEESLKDPEFYVQAVLQGIMRIIILD